ncbi:hypothetical protein DH2020_038119 [Rehmannia glutinosa]|uniref:CCHC-type domain-containing protein n=1 Tax=Rehmannia glutinosa TaxID=99300 RepID=A0ABR0V284_REHGL
MLINDIVFDENVDKDTEGNGNDKTTPEESESSVQSSEHEFDSEQPLETEDQHRGRPTRARRFEKDEAPNKGKRKENALQTLGRQKYIVTCKFCNEKGHNQKGCKKKKLAQENPRLYEDLQPQPEEMTQASDIPQQTQDEELTTKHVQLPVDVNIKGGNQILENASTIMKMTARKKTFRGSGFPPPRVQTPSMDEGIKLIHKGGKNYVTMSNLAAATSSSLKRMHQDTDAEKKQNL